MLDRGTRVLPPFTDSYVVLIHCVCVCVCVLPQVAPSVALTTGVLCCYWDGPRKSTPIVPNITVYTSALARACTVIFNFCYLKISRRCVLVCFEYLFTTNSLPPTHSQNTVGGGLHTQSQFTLQRPLHTMDQYRRIPYLYLLPPSLLHEVTTDTLTHLTGSLVARHQTPANDAVTVALNSLWSSYLSSFVSESVLYPLETVLVRLYCQGMPGLVDNVQSGSDVMFISTYYSGVLNCVREIWGAEGLWGFYKGFSSLLLRYAVHGALLVLLWRTVVFAGNRSKNTNRSYS